MKFMINWFLKKNTYLLQNILINVLLSTVFLNFLDLQGIELDGLFQVKI